MDPVTTQEEPRAEATFRRNSVRPDADGRREHPRFSVDLDVHFGSDHNFYAGFVENLSAGGIFVATHNLRPVGEHFEININLPDGRPIKAVGEVRWVREYSERSNVPPGMGIRFLELAPGADQAIADFLRERDPLFFDDE
ncbi:MAG: TIGR02266 family protein [Myxococcales bacterium]|nr:TIGR02266 family protein [Myxococcales bacterium]